MLRRLHPAAGILGFLTIFAFWSSTAVSELSGSEDFVVAVKLAIPWGLVLLVPALAVAGATGFHLAGGAADAAVLRKKRRMPFIAANGLLVLVPCALYLAALASRHDFGAAFYSVQTIEFVAGGVNLVLMALNIRDGMRLKGRLR